MPAKEVTHKFLASVIFFLPGRSSYADNMGCTRWLSVPSISCLYMTVSEQYVFVLNIVQDQIMTILTKVFKDLYIAQ